MGLMYHLIHITHLHSTSIRPRLHKKISFINEEAIADDVWEQARQFTADVDEKDTPFVALALSYEAMLWTGDRKLIEGLKQRGFTQVVDTASLLAHLNLT